MITSLQNNRVKEWVKLHKRKNREETNSFLIEEVHMIEEALDAGVVSCLIILEDKENIFNFEGEVEYVNQAVMDKISTNQSQVSYIAECNMISIDQEANHVLLLDEIQDPGNLGTLLRSALSFGFHKVVLGTGCVDLYNDKVLRSTQGALFKLSIIQTDLHEYIPSLQNQGFQVYGTSLSESHYLQDTNVSDKVAVLLGNEGQGVKESLLELCNQNIKIEMENFESLNVGVAGSICMYHFMVKSHG